ncbi:MAG: phosphonate ABC transporter, permease protein PhnE [Arhodomonas sp.]|nr:phosphonate ABC transporter, permease protein PhnE [Arhodomonas sp.]
MAYKASTNTLPSRLPRTGVLSFFAYLMAAAVILWSLGSSDLSLTKFARGVPEIGRLVSEMFPPALDRMPSIGSTMLQTFQMAVAGTVLGVLVSLPLAVLSARTTSPHWSVSVATRAIVTGCRTVPELIWAIIFVITVGLGPFAGVLALMVETTGFCARFFAEAMEEADDGPPEALRSLGATPTATVVSAVLPATLPSMIATSLFAFEKATRSSVVLGLVGAGGIGVELMAAMDMYDYRNVSTIILCVFVMVVAIEQLSSALRRRII